MASIKFTRIDPKTALNPVRAFNFTATDSLSVLGKAVLFGNIKPFSEDDEEKKSLLNTPIYDSLVFGNI